MDPNSPSPRAIDTMEGENHTAQAAGTDAFLARLAAALTDVRDGNFRRRLTPVGDGLPAQVATLFNEIVERDQDLVGDLSDIRVAAGEQGRLGERLIVDQSAGGWGMARESVNGLIEDLLYPTTELSQVLAAVADGDLSQRMAAQHEGQPLRGESARLCGTVNRLLDQLSAFAEEVTRVGREIGTEGKLGGQARVAGVKGTWKDLIDNVNLMAANLTAQVRDISRVATAVADGDLSRKITVEVSGEMLGIKNTVNTMVDQLSAFADEVTRVAREVGTEGQLGGQARVPGVAGIWRDLTDNVNFMAGNLTSQVRSIAQVTTAVARGDLSQKITVDVKGEILELKNTVNTMVDQLSAFADEVTRVAREVGTEGQLGGQARVPGVAGTWQWLTESVNKLAGNLTTQVRAIAAVATAVTAGDLTQQITVETKGEMADLKDNINRMIGNLKETTRANREQDWLKTNLARLSGLMQGHRDPRALAVLIMSELAPLVSAQQGLFFLADGERLSLGASYGLLPPADRELSFAFGESLVGQCAIEKKTIRIASAPEDYLRISSGLGSAQPADVIVLPVLYEGRVLGAIELASVTEFTDVHRDLLEQLKETIGVSVNTILVNSRTDALLAESQRLAQELGAGSAKLQAQQKQLQLSNRELAEKATQLATQNRDIELKNKEIEQGRQELEERAKQLSSASKYKSEFMANMSHELRTPLNSLLILAKLLSDNLERNLTERQVQFASTIHAAGSDLLQLIDDILDLAKVEAGHLQLEQTTVSVADLVGYVEALCRPLTAEKGLDFAVTVDPAVPATMYTDGQRLQQVLHNLLSNAVKFTPEGTVSLSIRMADAADMPNSAPPAAPRVAFAVQDTGIGIAADKLDVIFEAFQQADGTTSRKYGGTGLGLSISRELTQLLGGDLRVRSTPGLGTTFVLTVPMTPPPSASPAEHVRSAGSVGAVIEDSAVPVDGGVRRFHGERVLIVDDDLRNVFALSTVLELHGLRVVLADNGVSGIRALEQYDDIALVLMDVMMPELDGNATIAAIRGMSAHADLPVIAVTAKAMKGDREKSLASGATDYVPKPVDTDHLLNLIASYLEDDLNRSRTGEL
jgi:signal transduction histidine kinase/HAMP domain-containing protein/ActR/RegA family two-component response regulator